jgi:hypothetical protein
MKDKQPEQGFDLTARQATDRMVAALRKAHAMPPKEQKDMKQGKAAKGGRQITNNVKKAG